MNLNYASFYCAAGKIHLRVESSSVFALRHREIIDEQGNAESESRLNTKCVAPAKI